MERVINQTVKWQTHKKQNIITIVIKSHNEPEPMISLA